MTLDAKTNIGSTIQVVDQILKDFEEYYNKHIKDKEKGIEKVRLKYARTYQLAHRFFKWGLALSAFLMILSSRMGGLILEIFLSCAVLFFFLVFFLLNQKKLKMSQDYQYLVLHDQYF